MVQEVSKHKKAKPGRKCKYYETDTAVIRCDNGAGWLTRITLKWVISMVTWPFWISFNQINDDYDESCLKFTARSGTLKSPSTKARLLT